MSRTLGHRRLSFSEAIRGARACLPICLSVAVYGLVLGVLAAQAGLSVAEVALMSGMVYAGASQFVAIELWGPTPDIAAIVVAVGVINLRMMLITATLGEMFRPVAMPRALAAMFFVSDETWALTLTEEKRSGAGAGFLIGASLILYGTWVASTVAGAMLGTALSFDPARYGIDFVFTAVFLALLAGLWRGRADIVPWLAAALAGALVYGATGNKSWCVMAAGLAAAATGYIFAEEDP